MSEIEIELVEGIGREKYLFIKTKHCVHPHHQQAGLNTLAKYIVWLGTIEETFLWKYRREI